jgi:hypothetical protein
MNDMLDCPLQRLPDVVSTLEDDSSEAMERPHACIQQLAASDTDNRVTISYAEFLKVVELKQDYDALLAETEALHEQVQTHKR